MKDFLFENFFNGFDFGKSAVGKCFSNIRKLDSLFSTENKHYISLRKLPREYELWGFKLIWIPNVSGDEQNKNWFEI